MIRNLIFFSHSEWKRSSVQEPMYNTQNCGPASTKCLSIKIIGNAQGKGRVFQLNLRGLGIHPLNWKSIWVPSVIILNDIILYL